VVDTFGDEILSPHTMNIDRGRLADIVFNDRNKLAALNAIVHPVILAGIADHLEKLRRTDDIVILDAALLVEMGVTDIVDLVLVVTASDEVRKKRLLKRGLRAEDIDARIAAQADQAQLLERADIVVTNDGTIEELANEAERCWQKLLERKTG
jgi:dephospho-CoA kinase